MKKGIMGTLMAVGLMAVTAVASFAAGSVSTKVETATPGIEVNQINSDTLRAENVPEETISVIEKANAGELTVEGLTEAIADEKVTSELKGQTLVTGFVDVTADGAKTNADGSYTVTLNVVLPAGAKDVKVLHYSTERQVWEVLTADAFDVKAGTVTVTFKDLSPAAILAAVVNTTGTTTTNGTATNSGSTTANGSATTASAVSPKTGVESTWMGFMAAAVVLLGVSALAFRKSKRA